MPWLFHRMGSQPRPHRSAGHRQAARRCRIEQLETRWVPASVFADVYSRTEDETDWGAGEGTIQVEYSVSATRIDGSELPLKGGKPTVSVGEQLLVRVSAQDLRSQPVGVAAAYFDLAYTAGLLRFDWRENQTISIDPQVTGGSFTLTVTNPETNVTRTTGPIALDLNSPTVTHNNIRTALVALDNVEPGEITVDYPRIFTNLDEATNFVVRFGGRFANRDVPMMTVTETNLAGGQTPKVTVEQTSGVDPARPRDFQNSITFGESGIFRDVVDAENGEDGNPNVISDAGASHFRLTNGRKVRIIELQVTAIAVGALQLQTNNTELLPAHNTLLHGLSIPIPLDQIRFGGMSLDVVTPEQIAISRATVLERSSGAEVGTLSVPSQTTGTSFSFTVNDSRFEVTSNRLRLKSDQFLVAANTPTIEVEVVATDSQSPPNTKTQLITLSVLANPRPWQNGTLPLDTTGDGAVVPLDALTVINLLNNPIWLQPNGRLPDARPFATSLPFYDVNGDNFSTPQDALLVINHLNAKSTGEGEVSSSEPISMTSLEVATFSLPWPPFGPCGWGSVERTGAVSESAGGTIGKRLPAARTRR